MVYLYRTYTATVYLYRDGFRFENEARKCVGCSCVFRYELTRVVQGGGAQPFSSE